MGSADDLARAFEEHFAQLDNLGATADDALRFVEMLKRTGKAQSHRALVYRCPRRDALLEVYRTPRGAILYFPAYKQSRRVNDESSSPEGRAANTVDGDRRWKAHAGMLHTGFSYPLKCDHALDGVIDGEQIEADLAAGTSEVLIDSETVRYWSLRYNSK